MHFYSLGSEILQSGILQSGILQSGILQSLATDFGAGHPLTSPFRKNIGTLKRKRCLGNRDPTIWDPTLGSYNLQLPILELGIHSLGSYGLGFYKLQSWILHWDPTV